MTGQTYSVTAAPAPALVQAMFNFMEDCVTAAMRWG